jgi:nitroimidazol reductase NimA-like FMN-containing flavoprotein (pyridoxamine 5'-phosphate oxidase superfamily)
MTDLSQSPRSVVCFGLATLVEDEQTVRDATRKVEERYLEGASGPELEELLWFEGRTLVEITPVRWLAWDQGKG